MRITKINLDQRDGKANVWRGSCQLLREARWRKCHGLGLHGLRVLIAVRFLGAGPERRAQGDWTGLGDGRSRGLQLRARGEQG